jgi:hypothetical protein
MARKLSTQRIGILVSTSPLRKSGTFGGVAKQRFNVEAALELGTRFDLILVGSISADEVFQYLEDHLPPNVKPKFKFYNRTFFHQYQTDEIMRTTDDPRNHGWQEILKMYGIRFETLRSVIGEDQRHHQEKFTWDTMSNFIMDDRVILVTGSEGMLRYEKPVALERL